MNRDDLPTKEFLEDRAAMLQMPEAENPDLYKRIREHAARLREHRRSGGYASGHAIGVDVLTPEQRANFGREYMAFFEKAQKQAEEFERMSESQRAAIKAARKAAAEEAKAKAEKDPFGKAWAEELYALIDEYKKMRAAGTPKS